MNYTDEILNKYIDGELSGDELSLLKDELAASEDLQKKLIALKMVHSSLKGIPEDVLSSDFTSKVMAKISTPLKARKEDKYFFILISSIFGLIFSAVIIYMIYGMLNNSSAESSGSFITGLFDSMSDYLSGLKNIFAEKNLTLIGSISSFALLISGYFFFEGFKTSKRF